MPPGPELPAARLHLAAIASVCAGSSPITSRARPSTAARSAGVSEPPKKVSPTPTRPWSVPSSSVTNSRVSVGAGRPTTSGLSAGVRRTWVVTWVIFMTRESTPDERTRPGAPGAGLFESAAAEEVLVAVIPAVIPAIDGRRRHVYERRRRRHHVDGRRRRDVHARRRCVHGHRRSVHGRWRRDDDRCRGGNRRDAAEHAGAREDLVEHREGAQAERGVGGGAGPRDAREQQETRDRRCQSQALHALFLLIEGEPY